MASSTMNELRTGCRRGNVSALDALLYHCADAVYAMALTAVDDEATAQAIVREVWRRQLAVLKGLRFEADPAQQLWRLAERTLAERVGREEAHRARRAVMADDGAIGIEGISLPRAVLEELSALTHAEADAIRDRWRVRRTALRAGIAGLVVIALGVWAAVFYQRAQTTGSIAELQYECLRARIARQELPVVMREIIFQLDDPTGADKETAADCERVLLVLEEIGNAETLAQVNGLRYVRERVTRHGLPEFVRSQEETFPEMTGELMRVALVLEEVENL
ncbi:MAG TPA: hypothetical protein DEP45_09220 [Armatimonadetes bacterium]|nr:hypothetical protein [Armatimonadota bacterium]